MWTRNRGEVQETADTVAGRDVDALIITIGINDVGFSSLVSRATLHASGEKRKQRIAGLRNRIRPRSPGDLDRLKAEIDDKLHPRRVLLTSYSVNVFKEIADGKPRARCWAHAMSSVRG